MKRTRTRTMVEGALLIAVALVLSYYPLFKMPQGGAVTLEMLPLVLMGLRNGTKWGCFTGFVHGVLQMIIGFSDVLLCNTLLSQIGCILLDFLLAFTVLGLAEPVAKLLGEKRLAGIVAGTVVCGILRFLCSFLSGWLLWGSYAPEGMSAVVYSLGYNAAYMVPSTIIMAVLIGLLYKIAPKLFQQE